MSGKGFFDKVRKWIDGEEDFDEQGQVKARSKWDDFLVAVAREIETVMQREMFTPPGGPTYIPREYVVFLNPEDDAEWQGEKREGLQRGLHYVLSERAKALAGDGNFQTKSFAIELRVDAGLERSRFRVQPVWDVETERTMVQPRKRREAEAREAGVKEAGGKEAGVKEAAPEKTKKLGREADSGRSPFETRVEAINPVPGNDEADATIVRPRRSEDRGGDDAEATVVRPRKPAAPLFILAVRRNLENGGVTDAVEHPFYKDEITIGRGSSKAGIEVDLRLEGDMEISRTHARLKKTGDGEYAVTCSGANPIVLVDGGRELAKDERATVKAGAKIAICSYELAIQ